LFVNGESWKASGKDQSLMQRLAHQRVLSAGQVAKSSSAAQDLLSQWVQDGWAVADVTQHG
jgi:50S ribosomal protein L16 3-hydroxylase